MWKIVFALVRNKLFPGSPFHPSVTDPSRVCVVGGWNKLLGPGGLMLLEVSAVKTIEFDVSRAGPGEVYSELFQVRYTAS